MGLSGFPPIVGKGGVASLLRTTAQGHSFFAGIFMPTGNVGGRPSSVTPPPPLRVSGKWVGGSEGGWASQPNSRGGLTPPPGPQYH